MAEFQEVARQFTRMCDTVKDCSKCLMSGNHNSTGSECEYFFYKNPAESESIIMRWAAENPESMYPPWDDAWKQLFPEAWTVKNSTPTAPCLKHFLPNNECHKWKYPLTCFDCLKQPTPADIAQKLGIKPINQ